MSTTTSPAKPPIKTAKVQGRRVLHFANLDEMLADAEKLAASPSLKSLGNWTLGQALGHLTRTMNSAIDGVATRPPWFFRLIGRMMKKRVLRKMDPGFNLPPAAAKEMIPAPNLSTAQAIADFRAAVARLKATPDREPSPFLGRLTREESDRLQCSHAELHLSFFVP